MTKLTNERKEHISVTAKRCTETEFPVLGEMMQDLLAEIDLLGSRVAKLRWALRTWLASCPTDKENKYCEINQCHELRAFDVLAQDDGYNMETK